MFWFAKKETDSKIRKKKRYTDAAKHLPTAVTLIKTSSKQDLRKRSVFCNGRRLSSEYFS